MIRNRHDWMALYRALWVFSNPVQFAVSLLRHSAPPKIRLRTPTGAMTLHLRNFESLKTVFSVFCRGDYRTETDQPFVFLDIGANVGVSAVYFPVIVKLDVEGIERELIAHTDFTVHPNVMRLFCESTDCSPLIARKHVRSLRNGYVEDLRSLAGTAC